MDSSCFPEPQACLTPQTASLPISGTSRRAVASVLRGCLLR
jgi:hypothetical protein